MRYWLPSVALCACLPSLCSLPALADSLQGAANSSAASALTAPSGPASGALPAASTAAPSSPIEDPNLLAEQILARPELAAYHGWIRYLQFRAAHASERFSGNPGAIVEDRLRLMEWTRKILDNPNVLQELRGPTEWAYLSPVDGSGQPFKINIPTDYDTRKPTPVSILLHGHSGNHLEDASDMKDHSGSFEVAVLGRARGGYYRALSEADVLGAFDYVSQHWNIDRDRVHLVGGGMGGAGALWLGSRYPHLFASGISVAGSASDKPLGNLLTFPIYALHSGDDDHVTVLHARGPLAKLRALGGNVVLDEPTGYGHAVWKYGDGTARADAWDARQVRPASRSVKRLDFTALDGTATRDYWAEVSEWGAEPRPAHFSVEVAGKNFIKARLDNVRSLHLRLSEAPIDAAEPLRVALEEEAPLTLSAPLPTDIWLDRGSGTWTLANEAPSAPFRLHTPGGANQLYDGEPLLIVYGTRGDEATRAALHDAAVAASRSPSASWSKPLRDGGDDGVAYNQNLYGELTIKADRDVSAADLARCHLVLIGSAAQNSVVASFAARLPVRYEADTIRWNDGVAISAQDRALGLVHYNPDAPDRMIFWVASNDLAAYAAGSLAPELLGALPSGADAVVVRVSDPTLVETRSFDSRWHWLSREQSALLPAGLATNAELARAVAVTVRRAAPADFAVAGLPEPARPNAFEPGEARLVDLLAQNYFTPVSVMTVLGSDLAAAAQAIAATDGKLEPEPDWAHIQPQREYRLALSARQLSPFVRLTHLSPRKYEVLDANVASALSRYGVSVPPASKAAENAPRPITTASVGEPPAAPQR